MDKEEMKKGICRTKCKVIACLACPFAIYEEVWGELSLAKQMDIMRDTLTYIQYMEEDPDTMLCSELYANLAEEERMWQEMEEQIKKELEEE